MGSFHYLNEKQSSTSSSSQKYEYEKGMSYYGHDRPATPWNRLSISTPASRTDITSSRTFHTLRKSPCVYNLSDYRDYGGGGDTLTPSKRSSHHQLGKVLLTSAQDLTRPSNPNFKKWEVEWEETEKEKNEKSKPLRRSTCKFCDTTDKNGMCQCPVHLPAVHSRYMRSSEERSRNSIAIYLFRNGENRVSPVLIQIPKRNMRSMEDVMKVIEQSVRFPVGYANALFTLGGDMIYEPVDIKPYETYVVGNNIKRNFIQMDYGNKKPDALCLRRRRRFFPSGTFHVSLSPYK